MKLDDIRQPWMRHFTLVEVFQGNLYVELNLDKNSNLQKPAML